MGKRKDRELKINPPLGSPPAIQFVAVGQLAIDATYQRCVANNVSLKLIRAIAANWDWRLCVPLLVSSRDGQLYIIDGQHRHAAAVMRGDIPHLPCCVGSYSSAAEEAELFMQANRRRRAVNRLDDFRAAVAAGDEPSCTIARLLGEAGLSIASVPSRDSWEPGQLACTQGLYAALKKHGQGVVSASLTQIGEAFAGQRLHYGGTIFAGLVLVFASPPADFDPDLLAEALSSMTADEWGEHPLVEGESGGAQRALAFRRAVLDVCRQAGSARLEAA